MTVAIIVEGKNDRKQLQQVLNRDVVILCTLGTPGVNVLDQLQKDVGELDVFIFTDNDVSGKKIRGILRDTFPEAEHLYTRKGYAGVEGTPAEHLVMQLEKAGLDEYLLEIPSELPIVLHERLQLNKRRSSHLD